MHSRLRSFLQKVHEGTRGVEGLELLVLYGSLVRGELTSKSDIDFFALFHDERSLKSGEQKLSGILDDLCEQEYKRTSSLHAVTHAAEVDRSFLYNVFREGVAINPLIETSVWNLFSLKPHMLFTYSLRQKVQSEKAKIDRMLYGFKQKKRGKTYSYKGLADSLGAERLGNNLLVPLEKAEELRGFFEAHGIKFEQKTVFLPT
ncbi:MAG: nucleotidyltransferase domain-containing protein [Hadesarchaea archaeon]|nr:nucleotidyltransferase domain-containing protein [Hadesarchaea archaeon]